MESITNRVIIFALPQNLVLEQWDTIKKFIEPVIEISFGEVTLDGIQERLCVGEEIALFAMNQSTKAIVAVAILGITHFETGKRVLQIPYVGGLEMYKWLENGMSIIKSIAREQGCTHIRGCGRPGWAKAIPEFKQIRTIYECEV
jgi:hypothetical protein